jgi:hypothetical protein
MKYASLILLILLSGFLLHSACPQAEIGPLTERPGTDACIESQIFCAYSRAEFTAAGQRF